jgi:hypothetical protein
VRESKLRARARKLDEQAATFERDDPADPELGIESMRKVITCAPGGRRQMGLRFTMLTGDPELQAGAGATLHQDISSGAGLSQAP